MKELSCGSPSPPSWIGRLQRFWSTSPWMDWYAVYFILILYFSCYRWACIPAILSVLASTTERTPGRQFAGVLAGLVEDGLLATIFAVVLLGIDMALRHVFCGFGISSPMRAFRWLVRFGLVLGLTVLVLIPFAADLLILRTRGMRFTTEFIKMYAREKAEASAVKVEHSELVLTMQTIVITGVVSLLFALIYVAFLDLSRVILPAKVNQKVAVFATPVIIGGPTCHVLDDTKAMPIVALTDLCISNKGVLEATSELPKSHYSTQKPTRRCCGSRFRKPIIFFAVFVFFLTITLIITQYLTNTVTAIALNTTLNEIFRNLFRIEFQRDRINGQLSSARDYIHTDTEDFELFQEDVLYRRTTGFKGPLAFDVTVDQAKLPNVLVLVVESFRFWDSLYMNENSTISEAMKQHQLSVTPNFDRWAKRGVAFSNMWSSWQTSRSLESILFGQIPLDSVTETGTTYGREDTELSGMPQFFKQKGYETIFTTGCTIKYDQWDRFLPSHGFDTVLGEPEIRALAEKELGISPSDWYNLRLDYGWGIHDDSSFAVLGNLMSNKIKKQQEDVQNGGVRQPFFLNHYTISSHMPFDSRPKWFDSEVLPDFSPLYEGHPQAALVKKYVELRYFQDLVMGRFLDRMKAEGVLDDTLVVIVGDHGYAPEFGLSKPYVDQTSVTHVAGTIIAEGRLRPEDIGLLVGDAVEHYDLLNTLMDIVGVPSEGFLQTSVGRSLKRQVPYGSRAVWSNNPLMKLSVVKGDLRLVYDAKSSTMQLHNTRLDPLATHDLFPSESMESKGEFLRLRNFGRQLNAYFKGRWKRKCLTQVECKRDKDNKS